MLHGAMEHDQLPEEAIAAHIRRIRGHKVMLDSDLTLLFGVRTKRFTEQVKRDPARFPEDLMFVLNDEEWNALRSHFATLSGRGGRRYPPMAFTQHVVLMLSSVLSSEQAIAVNIKIMRGDAL